MDESHENVKHACAVIPFLQSTMAQTYELPAGALVPQYPDRTNPTIFKPREIKIL